MSRTFFVVLALFLFSAAALPAEGVTPDAVMLRYPDVSADRIVFLYANDLWTVSRDGGAASPLASPEGVEMFPKFSADGKTIAFAGNYDGNRDLYTVPVEGGVPFRITHHPSGEMLCDWTPDGRLLYYSGARSEVGGITALYFVKPDGGLPEKLPVPYGTTGAISPDGEWLAYTPYTRDFATWKRYRGGTASDIWLFNLKTLKSRKITNWEGTDTLPMWHRDRLYYLSDQGDAHRLNLWVYSINEGRHRQLTRFEDYDVKWPSIGPKEIVFQLGADLHLLDLETETTRKVKVTIPGARPTLKEKRVDASKFIQSWAISPTGKRVATQARGDIWTLPAEKGAPRNLNRTSGVAERDASWSPDGRWIAYFSDATGEYELYITQSDGKGETKQLTKGSTGYFYNPTWSPDSKKIVFSDYAANLYLCDVESGETKVIDQDPWDWYFRDVSWSHDSRWIAFARTMEEASIPCIHIHDTRTGETRRVTQGFHGDSSPVFDRKGDYLFYKSQRFFSPTSSEVSDNFIYRDSGALVAAPLRADMEWPWPEKNDEETWDDEKKKDDDEQKVDEEKKGDEEEEDNGGEKKEVVDDDVSGTWEGIANTPEGDLPFTMTLKLDPGGSVTGSMTSPAYSGSISGTYDKESGMLSATLSMDQGFQVTLEVKIENGTMAGSGSADGDAVTLTANRISQETADEDNEEGDKKKKEEARKEVTIDFEGFEERTFLLPITKGRFGSLAVNDKNQVIYGRADKGIMLFDLADEKKVEKEVAKGGAGFQISGDGKQLLLFTGGGVSIVKAAPGGSPKKVSTSGMTAYIDPREEWRQLLMDTWRIYREFFYVKNMHNVDWPGVYKRYEKMLDHCVTREELSYVIGEMISELNVGHAYYGGGDGENPKRVSVGLLGVDFALREGAYAFEKIYKAAAWETDIQSPLLEPGLKVKEGDFLLAVNGVPVDTAKDPWAAFIGTAGKVVTLTVSEKPVLDEEARDLVIKPTGSESELRYRAWIEKNRRYVEEKSGGKIGYMHIPDTAWGGRNAFVRQYYGQMHKKALIVDERWNSGGYDPYPMIARMMIPVHSFWTRRYGKDRAAPGGSHQGPKCMLINALAGSGGDSFPWQFRELKLGKLIGTRTWGGLVGLSGNPSLIDNGRPSVPTVAFYKANGTWGVEGHGVDPDIEVVDDPALMVGGGDPQLDAAIELMLKEIETYPYIVPSRPPEPDRSGMGIPVKDR
jgi:tricorn protease